MVRTYTLLVFGGPSHIGCHIDINETRNTLGNPQVQVLAGATISNSILNFIISNITSLGTITNCHIRCGGITFSTTDTGNTCIITTSRNGAVITTVLPNRLFWSPDTLDLFNPGLVVNPPVSGTTYQNNNPYPVTIEIPVTYNPSGVAAATFSVNKGFGSVLAVGTIYESEPAGLVTGRIKTAYIIIPSGAYFRFDTVNAVLGTAVVTRLY